jgi:stage II sporulation protein D (peptidoglycan lytic transglycosylase)
VRTSCLALGVALVACSTRAAPRVVRPPIGVDRGPGAIRVALAVSEPRVGGTRDIVWLADDGRTVLASGGSEWRVERSGGRVRAARGGQATPWQDVLFARPVRDEFLTVNARRYRGELQVTVHQGALVFVNRLPLEDYLKGVVPLEMGARPRSDSAALQAQAVASRSYAYTRVGDVSSPFDVQATVANQAYGGVEAEHEAATAAVEATRGMVLLYRGVVADAPYHSTCGGSTAEPPEVWRASGSPHLRRVSDRIPGTDRDYCAIAPRYQWTRPFSRAELNESVQRYLAAYASVPAGGPGSVRAITIRSRTESDRVGIVEIETERGTFTVRGDETRYVFRTPRGEILPSTYFIVEPRRHSDGALSDVTMRGKGNGHGVGMCQWGAIGRARAGQSFRSILATYYPGTTVGPIQ